MTIKLLGIMFIVTSLLLTGCNNGDKAQAVGRLAGQDIYGQAFKCSADVNIKIKIINGRSPVCFTTGEDASINFMIDNSGIPISGIKVIVNGEYNEESIKSFKGISTGGIEKYNLGYSPDVIGKVNNIKIMPVISEGNGDIICENQIVYHKDLVEC